MPRKTDLRFLSYSVFSKFITSNTVWVFPLYHFITNDLKKQVKRGYLHLVLHNLEVFRLNIKRNSVDRLNNEQICSAVLVGAPKLSQPLVQTTIRLQTNKGLAQNSKEFWVSFFAKKIREAMKPLAVGV